MINYNIDPYYDDFDPTKNYHRILFKPGRAVQARELTQSQTILQNQISQFASAIYSQNTPISGGKITTNLNCYYIKLNSTYLGGSIIASSFSNQTITDSTGTIVARVIATAEATGNSTVAGDPPTLIVTYLSGQQFSDGMTVYIKGSAATTPAATTIGVLGGSTSIGKSSVASISSGIFYVINGYNQITTNGTVNKYSIGNFVNVLPQTVVLDKYDNTPSLRIGLNIVETTTTSDTDQTLLDPALGSSNYQAPGADRYTINLALETRPLTLGNDDSFIELMKMNNGSILKQTDTTVYSAIDDYFAKRTFDTNGDFIVNNFTVTPTTNTANAQVYDLNIGPGIAYVRGYRLENQSTLKLTNPRARTTLTQLGNQLFVDYGNFLYVDTVKGTFDVTTIPAVDFHCVNTATIATANSAVYNSTKVGSGYIRNLVFDRLMATGQDANTGAYIHRAYITDFTANTLTGSVLSGTSTTITANNIANIFSSAANAYVGVSLSIDSGTSSGDTRTITQWTPSSNTFTVNKAFSSTPDSTSKFSLRFASTNINAIANANSTFALISKANINALSKTSVTPPGSTVSISTTQIQNPGLPELIYKLGNSFVANMSGASYSTTQVFRNKQFGSVSGQSQITISLPTNVLTFTGYGGTTSLTSSSVEQNYTIVCVNNAGSANIANGDIVSFATTSRTANVSSDGKTLVLAASDTANIPTNMIVNVIAKMNVNNGDDTTRVVRLKTLVKGNTTLFSTAGPTGIVNSNTFVDTANGQVYILNGGLVSPGNPQYLYVTDVKKIDKIIDTYGQTPSVSMITNSAYDITNNYNFDNGQRDNTYEHSRIVLKPGAPQPKGNVLVIFDYYQHSGGDGYFAANSSYTNEDYGSIPTYIAKDGNVYNLRDCIDFRPSRKNATATVTYEYTGNPPSDDTGVFLPQDLTTFTSNYGYYLARNDLLVLSKDNYFKIINGVPSITPTLPSPPDGALIIANIFNDPYTSYLPSETPLGYLPNMSLQTVQHQRFTMQDIAGLQTRINNVEYYTSLSLLEQKTQALQVPDSNGLNRFKNGILVDDFSAFATADTGNADFNANIDTVNKQMSATQTVTGVKLEPLVPPPVANTPDPTPPITLPWTPNALVTQRLASGTVSVNPFTAPIFEGVMKIYPPMDNWIDRDRDPDLLLVDPNLNIYQTSNTSVNKISVGNWQTVIGSEWRTSSVSSRINHGSFINPVSSGSLTNVSQVYSSQPSKTLDGTYSKLPATYTHTNNYVKNVAIQPYVRPQDLTVRASFLKVNTPITSTFDDVVVDSYISMPTVMELNNVKGVFLPGDKIGYTSTGNFNLLGTVLDVYNYPNTSNTRLYVYVSANTTNNATVTTIQNAVIDANTGLPTASNTAFGTPASGTNNGVSLCMSGFIVAANNGTSSNITGGGTYSTGVTQIKLSPLSSSSNNFYGGTTGSNSKISITSTNGSTTTYYSANIIGYNGVTKIATLDNPVAISIGYNSNTGTQLTSSYRINGTQPNYLASANTGLAPQISTNEAGNFVATYSIPANTFRQGNRIFRVDNRVVLSDASTATTHASGTFIAGGLSSKVQNPDNAVSHDTASKRFIPSSLSNNRQIPSNVYTTPYDPIAQTFTIDKANYPNGVFLSSVKLFFYSKPTTSSSPVKLSIVATQNGTPNGNILDHSTVVVPVEKVNVSSTPHYLDANTYTEFVFTSPVLVKPDTLYSFMLSAQSPEYTVWLAEQGGTAVSSTVKNLPTDVTPAVLTKINNAPYVGSLFESQNGGTWTAETTKSLMFVINQAQFNTTSQQITFTVPKWGKGRKSIVNDVESYLQANNIWNFDKTLSTSNIVSHAHNITTTDLIPTGTNIGYRHKAQLVSGGYDNDKDIIPGRYGHPKLNHIRFDDRNGPRVIVANSNNSVTVNVTMTTTDSNVSPVVSQDGLTLYNVVYNINNLPLSNSQIVLVSGGSGYGYNTNTTVVSVSSPDVSGGVQAFAAANVVGGVIQSVYVTTPGSGYLNPPTISITDTGSSNASFVAANVQVVSEFSPKGGNALTRYFTKKVVLAPGNDSGDLRVYLTAYRPVNTNVYVFYKILNASDTQPFDAGSWQLMTPIVNQTYYSTQPDDVVEFQYAPGINNIANNSLSYTSTTGTTYKSFIQFAVKVVLTSADSTNIPYLTNMRALALPPGTGI